MANIYVDSNATGSPNDGTSWTTAFQTLEGAAGVDAAGDVIWVAHNHAEVLAITPGLFWEGTKQDPTRIICGRSDSGQPPTVLATTATITITGDNDIDLWLSGHGYMYGITVNGSTTDGAGRFLTCTAGASIVVFESCNFNLQDTHINSIIGLTNSASNAGLFINCGFQFSSVNQGVSIAGVSRVVGGSILADAAIQTFVKSIDSNARLSIEGFNFANCDAALNISQAVAGSSVIEMRNCKLPASWSGSMVALEGNNFAVGNLYNSDWTDRNYRLLLRSVYGDVFDESILVKTDGASDGTTRLSWKMVSNAYAEWNHQTHDSPQIARWVEDIGQPITVTVDIMFNGAQVGSPAEGMTDRHIWLEVEYLGTSGVPLSRFIGDAASSGSPYQSDYLAAGVLQETSSATWATTNIANPIKQKLSVTFTPMEKGYIYGVVKLARASTTVYVDPVLQVN